MAEWFDHMRQWFAALPQRLIDLWIVLTSPETYAWMAWTWQTALFFAGIASALLLMTLLAIFRPETERVGVLRIATTRGDRLFISLLGSAFIHLAWIGLMGGDLWKASIISLVYAAAVFRWV